MAFNQYNKQQRTEYSQLAAICITQVAAFHFLTNYLSTIQKSFLTYFNLMMFRELAGISTVAPFFSVVT